MFKISEFSQLSQVSVKTLRYYDQLGLLKPAHIDPWTGYRYYTADQLLRLNRIMAFKDLGFTLQQIVRLLDEQVPAEQIRGMFRLKQAQLQELIAEEQARLARIEGRLRQIEREGSAVAQQEVVLKSVDEQLVASIRVRTAASSIPLLIEELDAYLVHHGVASVASLPHLVLWHGCEECEDATDLEVACPIPRKVRETERITVHRLPALPEVATLMHECHLHSTCSASADLANWIEAHPYQMVEGWPRREIFLTHEEGAPSIAEVQIPVVKEVGR